MNRVIKSLLLGCCAAAGVASAIELPVRYKVGAFDVTQRKTPDNWVTNIGVRYSSVSTRDGYDGNAQRTSALDVFGQTNLVRLGFGLEGLATMPATHACWNVGYDQTAGVLPVPPPGAFGPLDIGTQNFVKTTGRVAAQELTFNLEQNLFSGFFVQCYLPFRSLTIDNIGYQIAGSQVMPAPANNVDNFVTTILPPIMREQGMEAPLTVYRKSAVAEVVAGLGWQGYNDKGFGVIHDATGRVFIGAIIPGGGRHDTAYMTGLPLGYDGFFGVHTRIELEVGIQKCLALGAASSVNIFFSDIRTHRVMSDAEKKQTGLLSFVQARVNVDQGPVWDVSGYAKLQRFFYGLTGLVGYSFSRQEQTNLLVKDDKYLNGAVQRYVQQLPPKFLNTNDVINADQRLMAWQRQMLHFSIGYDFALHPKAPKVAPAINFEFGYPIDGRRVMTGKYLGGTASAQFKLLF